jgi:tetratricopeptide (TPR) repeat protein
LHNFYLLKGKIEYEANRKVEAMNSLNEAIYINDKILFRTPLYNAYFLRGLNNIKLGRLSEALSDIGIAKQGLINISWGEWNQIDSLLSNAYSSDGLKFKEKESKLDYKDLEYEYDRAEKQLELAIQIFKFNANAYYGKAEIRYAAANYLGKRDDIINSQSKYEEAIDLYNKALFYNNNLSDANFKIGLIQKQKGEYEPAIISFNNAIKNDPKNIHILIERAKTFLNQNEYDRAVIDFSLALKFLTDTIKFSKNYGKTPIDSKKILYENLSTTFELTWKKLFLHEEIANRIILDSAFTLRVNNGLGRSSSDYFKKGLIYYKSGIEFQKAANEFSKCIKSGIEDLDPSFFSYYGIAELFNNKDSLAFKLLSYAVIKTESNPLAYYGLGCYYAKKSNSIGYLKAYYCFERAFSLSQALSTQINENDISFMNKTFLQGFLKDELWGELYRLDFELEKELLAKEKIKSTN